MEILTDDPMETWSEISLSAHIYLLDREIARTYEMMRQAQGYGSPPDRLLDLQDRLDNQLCQYREAKELQSNLQRWRF